MFCSTLRHDVFSNRCFLSVFGLPSLRNTRKCDETKKVEEKLTSIFFSIFWGKAFDMDFLQNICVVFLNPPALPRNTQKRTKKSQEKQKSDGGWVGLGFSKCTGGRPSIYCLPAPRAGAAVPWTGSGPPVPKPNGRAGLKPKALL
jgi:hypothetical protein